MVHTLLSCLIKICFKVQKRSCPSILKILFLNKMNVFSIILSAVNIFMTEYPFHIAVTVII